MINVHDVDVCKPQGNGVIVPQFCGVCDKKFTSRTFAVALFWFSEDSETDFMTLSRRGSRFTELSNLMDSKILIIIIMALHSFRTMHHWQL